MTKRRSWSNRGCESGSGRKGRNGGSGGRSDCAGRGRFVVTGVFLAAFFFWTLLVCNVDVEPVGPCGSEVGLASLNIAFHEFAGVSWVLYELTDWLSLVPIACMLIFALLGLCQLVGRRGLAGVDRDLLVLGGFYAVLLVAYLGFDALALNYRPVLVEGVLEPSYPSSTTLLVLCVVPTTIMQVNRRIRHAGVRRFTALALAVFAVFVVAARLFSGVHWLSDIIGGMLLSGGLVLAYGTIICQDARARSGSRSRIPKR